MDGSILEEGITHEQYWNFQQKRRRAIQRKASRVLGMIYRFGRPGSFLEIGVGTGHILPHLSAGLPPGTPICGIDNDPTMIDYARKATAELEDVRLEAADGRGKLPFADESFSIVFSEHTFHHMKVVDNTLAEIARVMADDGAFILVELDPGRLLSRLFRFGYPFIRAARIGWPIGEGAYRSLARSFTYKQLLEKFSAAGLRVIHRSHSRLDHVLVLKKGVTF